MYVTLNVTQDTFLFGDTKEPTQQTHSDFYLPMSKNNERGIVLRQHVKVVRNIKKKYSQKGTLYETRVVSFCHGFLRSQLYSILFFE